DDYLLKQNIDELTKYQIIYDILSGLDFNDPLGKKVQDTYIYSKDIISLISLYKKGGFTPDELAKNLQSDKKVLIPIDQAVADNLSDVARISAGSIDNFENLLAELIELGQSNQYLKQIITSLSQALVLAKSQSKVDTKPLTKWKNSWTTKNDLLKVQTKYSINLDKLISLVNIWNIYQDRMKTLGYYDFDDMILQVTEVLRKNPSLLANIQETFYYTMVDEFQDTSRVQVNLLEILMDSPVNEGRPNILIVGDDDQAIYGFQGAEYSNFSDYINKYKDVLVINLTDNYRSTDQILSFARSVVVQNPDRLENNFAELSKELSSQVSSKEKVLLLKTEHMSSEYVEIINKIKSIKKSGKNLSDIAIIAPKHKHLESIAKFLQQSDIDINYERRQNVLDNHALDEIITILRFINSANEKTSNVDVYLSKILAFDWLGVAPMKLYQTSLYCYKNKVSWVEHCSKDKELSPIINWLLILTKKAKNNTLEEILDLIIDSKLIKDSKVPSFKDYYFSNDNFELEILSGLIIFRNNIRALAVNGKITIDDLLKQIDMRIQANIQLANNHPVITATDSVNLITAHSAKGQEFDTVFIIHASQRIWVEEKSATSKISVPEHHSYILPDYSSWSEKHRLFYVASTRAKNGLILTMSSVDDNGKDNLLNEWANQAQTENKVQEMSTSDQSKETLAKIEIEASSSAVTKDTNLRDYLNKLLEDYSLSPTQLNAFIDVANSSLDEFLLNQILRFPKSYSIDASFGSIAHTAISDMHQYFSNNKKILSQKTTETKLHKNIDRMFLTENEKAQLKQRLGLLLSKLTSSKELFDNAVDQLSELDFSDAGIVINGDSRIKGIIDRIDIDEKAKTIVIIDYKTGKGYKKWPNLLANNFDSIKLHKYKQQLYFYYLLLKNHPKYKNYDIKEGKLVFVESLVDNAEYSELSLEFDPDETKHLEKLIESVYQNIKNLDFLDIKEQYSKDISGIRQFEEDLLKNSL
ncbi:MAG: ATP-dependent DNA helicase, partial [Patescibacteria group bacterium]